MGNARNEGNEQKERGRRNVKKERAMRGNGEMTVKVKVNEVKRGERRESSRESSRESWRERSAHNA